MIDTNLRFISEKIADLQTAVMYSMSNSLIKLPNDVVTFVKVDENGQLWFLSHLPCQSLKECEQVFPARLHFFRKGRNYFVEVSGKATVMSKVPSTSSFDTFSDKAKKAVLIKMTMSNIQYVEPGANHVKPKWKELAETTHTWMLRNITFRHPATSSISNFNNHH
ncbi:MAG: hypothetical protein SGI96_20840 [Bacteroidota bacterium]|nr:hypothetical protein [Bacteroidota bacterium]